MERNHHRRYGKTQRNTAYKDERVMQKIIFVLVWFLVSMMIIDVTSFLGGMLHTALVAVWKGLFSTNLVVDIPTYCSAIQIPGQYDVPHALCKGIILSVVTYILWLALIDGGRKKYCPTIGQKIVIAGILILGHEALELGAYLVEFLIQAAGEWITGKPVITLANTLSQYKFDLLAVLCEVFILMKGINIYAKLRKKHSERR